MRTMTVARGAVAGMTAEIAIMNTSCGNPRMTSVPRDANPSHQPPKYPAVTPTMMAMVIERMVAPMPMRNEVRVPSTTMAKRSRPV